MKNYNSKDVLNYFRQEEARPVSPNQKFKWWSVPTLSVSLALVGAVCTIFANTNESMIERMKKSETDRQAYYDAYIINALENDKTGCVKLIINANFSSRDRYGQSYPLEIWKINPDNAAFANCRRVKSLEAQVEAKIKQLPAS